LIDFARSTIDHPAWRLRGGPIDGTPLVILLLEAGSEGVVSAATHLAGTRAVLDDVETRGEEVAPEWCRSGIGLRHGSADCFGLGLSAVVLFGRKERG
ncbi:hypothetical protein CLOP_g12037, partial [Closterium sp. NIES-67]